MIEKPAPINVSNVMIVCPACNRPTRIGVEFKEDKGRKVRSACAAAPTATRRSTGNGHGD